jgi:hypothetical protein
LSLFPDSTLFGRAYTPRHRRRSRTATVATATTAAAGSTAALLAGDVSVAAAHDRSFPTMLSELRQCESGGNYRINTGNGYYGAYQFNLGTWQSVGGTGYPHQNPPEVQDEMATRLYERRGWAPWPSCSRSRGLHATTVERPWAGSAPEGNVDGVAPAQGGIDVRGWAFDRDNTPTHIQVHAYVDGKGALAMDASSPRPDVGSAYGVGDNHGFVSRVPATPGAHTICFYAINVEGGGGNTSLGCSDVTVPRPPIGHVDSVEIVPQGIRVRGWTLDKDTPAQPTRAHLYVDGEGAASVTADESRPDVAQAFGVPEARGYDVVVPAGSEICGFAIDTTGSAGNTLLGCEEAVDAE